VAKDARIPVRTPQDLKDWAQRYALRKGTSVSDLLRKHLEELRELDQRRVAEEVAVHEF
jgi:hypothetical protein